MNELTQRFDGLAFPVITVRLANNKGTARMETYDDRAIRATVAYSYDQRDGQPFALKCAEAVWAKHVAEADKRGFGDIVERDPVFIPGNAGTNKGYVFIAVPAWAFGAQS